MKSLARELHKIFFNSRLRITLSELSEASEVSPSQIRYWEKKGYIQSSQGQKNQSHKYTIKTLGTVMGIKYYLNQGFTLAAAYEKQNQQRGLFKCIKFFTMERVRDIQIKDQGVVIDLGKVDNVPGKRVMAFVDDQGNSKLILQDDE